MAAMERVVAVIEGCRGRILESVLRSLFAIFGGAGGGHAVLAEFEAEGGVVALPGVVEDETATNGARVIATELLNAFFGGAESDE
jgi:hypothetical protein